MKIKVRSHEKGETTSNYNKMSQKSKEKESSHLNRVEGFLQLDERIV